VPRRPLNREHGSAPVVGTKTEKKKKKSVHENRGPPSSRRDRLPSKRVPNSPPEKKKEPRRSATSGACGSAHGEKKRPPSHSKGVWFLHATAAPKKKRSASGCGSCPVWPAERGKALPREGSASTAEKREKWSAANTMNSWCSTGKSRRVYEDRVVRPCRKRGGALGSHSSMKGGDQAGEEVRGTKETAAGRSDRKKEKRRARQPAR